METQTQVMALHPAPVGYIPERSRKWRFDLIQQRVPVTLRHASPDAFEPADLPLRGWRGEKPRIYRADGALWSPCLQWNRGDDYASIHGGEIARFLEDNSEFSVQCAFMETPANARLRSWDSSRWGDILSSKTHPSGVSVHPVFRGLPIDLDAVRDIRWDGRDRAARELRSYLDRNVRIVGDEAFFRRDDMMTAAYSGSGESACYRWEESAQPMNLNSGTFLATPETFGTVRRYLKHIGEKQQLKVEDNVYTWLKAVPPAASRGEDVVKVLNTTCLVVRSSLDHCMAAAARQGEAGSAGAKALAEMRDAAVRAEGWSWTGSFGRDDPIAAIAFVLKATDAVADAREGLGVPADKTAAAIDSARHLRDLYLPMAIPDIDPDDEMNIAAIAP